MTPERRQEILDYIEAKYPKGGRWNMSLRRPREETKDGQEEPAEPAT